MLADEKVMPEKKPPLVLLEEKAMSDEKRRRRKTSRSPPPSSCLPGDPADGPESGIATAGEHVDKMSKKAEEEPYITSTKNPFAILGELMDAEAATEATGSLDKMSGWPEGGIASAVKIVDKMSGCARARPSGARAARQCPCRAVLAE